MMLCPRGRCMLQLKPLSGEHSPPAPFAVKPECVDGGKELEPDLSDIAKYISDARIAEVLGRGGSSFGGADDGGPAERTVAQTKRAIHAAHTVIEHFYYGSGGLEGLDYAVGKRMRYLLSVFHSAEKLEWWVAQIVASGAPDFMCEHTGEEVHLYCLNARQIACFVRTGYDPKDGILPQDLHTRVPLDGKY